MRKMTAGKHTGSLMFRSTDMPLSDLVNGIQESTLGDESGLRNSAMATSPKLGMKVSRPFMNSIDSKS